MIDFKQTCLSVISKFMKKDKVVIDFYEAISISFKEIENTLLKIKNNYYFDKLTETGCRIFEDLMQITPKKGSTIEERQDVIRAKWRSSGKNSIELIQRVCDSWKNGEIQADFVNGKIVLKFVGEYGIPDDLESLIQAVEEIKMSHLPFALLYKYLLIKDIHEVKTIEQMNNIPIGNFAFKED